MASRRPHPLEAEIEAALSPGEFIDYRNAASFLSDLERVRDRIDAFVGERTPTEAVSLFEAFVAGCYAKADEVDDSDGELGLFVGSLVEGWIKARQAAGEDADATAVQLVTWVRSDDYGFMSSVEDVGVAALDGAGRAAFERILMAEVAAPSPPCPGDGAAGYWHRHARDLLKSVYVCGGQVDAFLKLSETDGVTPRDCEVVAEMYQARRKDTEALEWVERGLAMERAGGNHRAPGHRLPQLRRVLLRKAGRAHDAVDAAWADYARSPSTFSYESLLKEVPGDDASGWRARALDLAEHHDLGAFIAIAAKTNEWDRLAARVLQAPVSALEGLSHYTLEPAAESLETAHPRAAARLFEALGMRILVQKKSAYYGAALRHLQHAKRCYESAGERARWAVIVAAVRRDHGRKSSFMPGFERIVRGEAWPEPRSFLDAAKERWRTKTRDA